MSVKNVIILNDFAFINGGASKVALDSARGLAKLGYSVIVFCCSGPIQPDLLDYPNLRIVLTGQKDILTNPNRIESVFQGLWNIRSEMALQSILKELNPQETVVHLHSWTKALSSSVVRIVRKMGFPLVCTMHDYFLACPNGAFYNYPKGKICTLRALSIPCLLQNCDSRNYLQKIWRFGRSMIERSLGGLPTHLQHIITVSDFSQAVIESYLSKTVHIHRIENPIDIPRMPSSNVQENNLFIAMGRIAKEKGSELFAKACNSLGIISFFIGDGPRKEEVLKINPLTKITGWLPHEKAIHLLRESGRALVFSSVMFESQGLVVLEAAACGVPTIVSDATAAQEFVINGVTGLYYKSGDYSDLEEKIVQLQDKETARRMGQAAYENYWANPPSLELHLRNLERIYSEML